MSNQLRFQVVEEAFKKKAVEVKAPSERPSEYFGKYVFTREKMYKYLPIAVYNKLIDVIDNGARLDRSIADAVAEGMKKWAQEMGIPADAPIELTVEDLWSSPVRSSISSLKFLPDLNGDF